MGWQYVPLLLVAPLVVDAAVTVHHPPEDLFTMTQSSIAPGETFSGNRAYDPTELEPPENGGYVPNFDINLQPAATQDGLSHQLPSPFFGFSIEMSVSNQVYGRNSTQINVPFLNLMSNIAERAGEVHIRCGGNTQESAVMVESNPNGLMIDKDYSSVSGTTNTPPIDYTIELIYTLGNISALVPVKWWVGIPFDDIHENPIRMDIANAAINVIGENLLGFQAGNEPDYYGKFGRRPPEYTAYDYMGEVGDLINLMSQDPQYEGYRNLLVSPSIAMEWPLQETWDTGIIENYREQIRYMSVERYPDNNCGAVFGTGGAIRVPQELIGVYLDHHHLRTWTDYYIETGLYAQQMQKPLIMFETNTASCGGFPGISNAFAGALWGLDYALQLARKNFSEALFHVGGQSVYYNPFTAAPTNQTSFSQWTVGPTYYVVLIMAEIVGKTGTARVADLFAAEDSNRTPAYAIYEGEEPARVALFNTNTDPSGGHTYTASINVPQTISSVQVKRLAADRVTQINNFTWAGQTWGAANFEADGRPHGEYVIETLPCTPGEGGGSRCPVSVPAPGFALVFLQDGGASAHEEAQTYATSAIGRERNTATIDRAALETSNGHNETVRGFLGSTSYGSQSGATTLARLGVASLGIVAATMYTLLSRLR